MTRFSVAILPEAEAEFREAFLWYFERSPLAANAFRTEVFDKIDALATDADSWPQDENAIHFRDRNRSHHDQRKSLCVKMGSSLLRAHSASERVSREVSL